MTDEEKNLNNEAKIINLLSEAAKSEVERRKIEEDKLAVTYELLSILHQRKDIEKENVEIIRLIFALINELAEEVIGYARETNEKISLLSYVILNDKDDVIKDNVKALMQRPNAQLEEVQTLITLHQKVLAKYREQAARYGMHVPPFIEIEIENTERTITELQEKLREM